MLQDPTVPPKRNLDTHRCHHMLYKDTWIELMLGEQQGAGVGLSLIHISEPTRPY